MANMAIYVAVQHDIFRYFLFCLSFVIGTIVVLLFQNEIHFILTVPRFFFIINIAKILVFFQKVSLLPKKKFD